MSKITINTPPRFRDIPSFTVFRGYSIDVSWNFLKKHMAVEDENGKGGIDLDPDFQRGHVWDLVRQTAFVEFMLRGGDSARNIYFNCPKFHFGGKMDYVIVDGKQRLTAALAFLDDKIPVFGGHVFSDFTDSLDIMKARFRWNVNDLATRAEVLQWYIEMNTGGVVHTDKEIMRVKNLLEKETAK